MERRGVGGWKEKRGRLGWTKYRNERRGEGGEGGGIEK